MSPTSSVSKIRDPGSRVVNSVAVVVFPAPKVPFSQMIMGSRVSGADRRVGPRWSQGAFGSVDNDYLSCLLAVREYLEEQGQLLCCQGARPDVWPSGIGARLACRSALVVADQRGLCGTLDGSVPRVVQGAGAGLVADGLIKARWHRVCLVAAGQDRRLGRSE